MFSSIAKAFSSVFARFSDRGTITERDRTDFLEKITEALIEADVPQQVIDRFVGDMRSVLTVHRFDPKLRPAEQLTKLVYDRLTLLLGGSAHAGNFSFQIPSVCLVMGLQGSGKTTTLGKLAHLLTEQAKKRGKQRRILLASVDFQRPAAIDQLRILAERCQVMWYESSLRDPVKAAEDILRYGRLNGCEHIFIDTAGRLHVEESLMDELVAIDRAVGATYKVLVVDGMIGQESLAVAERFQERLGFTGAIITKLDSGAKAGVALAFRALLQKPILFMGTGEGLADLEYFQADRVAQRMLDMGDLATLLEQAESKLADQEKRKAQAAFKQGLTLQDFADQLAMVDKIGSIQQIMKYIPGMGTVDPQVLQQGEKDLKKFRAIISSMTLKERVYPAILDGSRKRRIAQGAGVQVADITQLLDRFEQNRRFATLFKKMQRF